MLFNSGVFIFVFLPVVLALFYAIGRAGNRRLLLLLLLAAATVFYAVGAARHLPLLAASILFNYWVSLRISASSNSVVSRRWLSFAVVVDLGTLAFFKYAPLFQGISVSGEPSAVPIMDLPVGISFYTFTQIAFLVDLHRRVATRHPLGDYAAFVSYFPHLVAGPVLHHTDVLPQLSAPAFGTPNFRFICSGVVLFALGLAKKVLLADSVADVADGVFFAAGQGADLSIAEAWLGVIAYALQIYFDFSGYSDMARGISRMFSIELPINFDSPYRASSLIDFWRRWHITLSRFLRNYLYIPLGGNRSGKIRTAVNLVLTMALGGLWHGAGYGFLVWGLFHGVCLALNHAWREYRPRGVPAIPNYIGWAMTLFVVTIGWVFFRSSTLGAAGTMLSAMLGLDGVDLPAAAASLGHALPESLFRFDGTFLHGVIVSPVFATVQIIALSVLALQPWNTNRIVALFDGAGENTAPVARLYAIVAASAVLFAFAIASLGNVSPFLYYQF